MYIKFRERERKKEKNEARNIGEIDNCTSRNFMWNFCFSLEIVGNLANVANLEDSRIIIISLSEDAKLRCLKVVE